MASDSTAEPSRREPVHSRFMNTDRSYKIIQVALPMSAGIAKIVPPPPGARTYSKQTNPRVFPSRGLAGREMTPWSNRVEALEEPPTFTIPRSASVSQGKPQ